MRKSLKKMLETAAAERPNNEVFCSSEVGRYLSKKAHNVHQEWFIPDCNVSVSWDENPNSPIAFTDNRRYYINAGNPFVTENADKLVIFNRLCGLTFHEMGHRLFTSFSALHLAQKGLEYGAPFGGLPVVEKEDEERRDDFCEYIKDTYQARNVISIMHGLANAIEDGRIEYLLLSKCSQFKVFTNGLQVLRGQHYADMDDFSDIIEAVKTKPDYHEFVALSQMILSYAKYGEIKGLYDDPQYKEERIYKCMDRLLDDIDEACSSIASNEFYNKIYTIMIKMWDIIKDYIKTFASDHNEEQKGESGSGESSGNGNPGSEGSSEPEDSEGSKSGADNDNEDDDNGSNNDSNNGSNNDSNNGSNNDSNNDDSSEDKLDGDYSDEIAKDIQEKTTGTSPGIETSSTESEGTDDATIKAVMDITSSRDDKTSDVKNPDRLPLIKTDSITSDGTGEIIYENGEEEDIAPLELEKILADIGAGVIERNEESGLINSLENTKNSMQVNNIHENINISIIRPAVSSYAIEEYNLKAAPLKKIAKDSARKLKPLLEEDEGTGYVKSQYAGAKFNSGNLVKKNLRDFSRRTVNPEAPTLAVAIVIDESGSMCGDRCLAARAAAISLKEMCDELNIAHAIYGHSTDGRGATIYTYADFDKPNPQDKYRLMSVSARCGNRDGLALQFAAERLDARPEMQKMLFIISDGQPADYGYVGTAAEEDLRDIVARYTKKDISIFAVAIGDDKESIERIYGSQRFLDISNLADLPKKLINMVKRRI